MLLEWRLLEGQFEGRAVGHIIDAIDDYFYRSSRIRAFILSAVRAQPAILTLSSANWKCLISPRFERIGTNTVLYLIPVSFCHLDSSYALSRIFNVSSRLVRCWHPSGGKEEAIYPILIEEENDLVRTFPVRPNLYDTTFLSVAKRGLDCSSKKDYWSYIYRPQHPCLGLQIMWFANWKLWVDALCFYIDLCKGNTTETRPTDYIDDGIS